MQIYKDTKDIIVDMDYCSVEGKIVGVTLSKTDGADGVTHVLRCDQSECRSKKMSGTTGASVPSGQPRVLSHARDPAVPRLPLLDVANNPRHQPAGTLSIERTLLLDRSASDLLVSPDP